MLIDNIMLESFVFFLDICVFFELFFFYERPSKSFMFSKNNLAEQSLKLISDKV